MNKIVFVFAVVSVLAGCVPQPESNADKFPGCTAQPHTNAEPYTDMYGTTVDLPAEDLYIKNERITEIYEEVIVCMNMPYTPGPQMWFRKFSENNWGGAWGFTHNGAGLIAVNTDIDDQHQRNCISDEDTIRHEFIHYIAYMNGLESDHSSPYFEQCRAVGVKTCNGVPCR